MDEDIAVLWRSYRRRKKARERGRERKGETKEREEKIERGRVYAQTPFTHSIPSLPFSVCCALRRRVLYLNKEPDGVNGLHKLQRLSLQEVIQCNDALK